MGSTGRIDPLAGGGEMGALMRSLDWSRTAVGAAETWPQSLRTALSILLETGFPMYIAWGPELTQFYNDGYRPILGSTKHPAAMGASTRATFAEIWDIIGPMFQGVMEGRATTLVDFLLPLDRNGFVEECYFIFSYSPIRQENGEVGGVLVTVTETTERVLGARRLRTLQELASRTQKAATAEAACESAAFVLSENPADLPFALLYLLDAEGKRATLASAAGLAPGSLARRAVIDLEAADPFWPLAAVVESRTARVVEDLPAAAHLAPVRQVVAIPIAQAGERRPTGVLVAAVSPRLILNESYRSFLELAAGQIATAIGHARALAEALAEIDRAKATHLESARQRLEAERGRERLAALFLQAPVAICVMTGPELVFDLANPLYERMVGRTGIVGLPIREAFPELPEDAPVFEVLTRVYTRGEPFAAEEYPVPLDLGTGEVADVFFKFTVQPMHDHENRVVSVIAVAVDVTSQVTARREVEAARRLLEAVVNQIPSGVLLAEAPSGRTLLANARVSSILGHGALATRSVQDFAAYTAVHADGRPFAANEYALTRALAGEVVLDEEILYNHPDGERRVLAASAAPVYDADGRIVAAVNAFSDITGRKRVEEQNRQLLVREREARAEAEVANRSKDEFLAMLGHELRNPLAPIVTALQLMRLRGDESLLQERTMIERQVHHLIRLVDDLLDVSRITRGKIELKRERIEIAEVVAKAIEMASPLIEQRQHTLRVEVPRHGLAVEADAVRMAQVVANLLNNAAKYTEPHGLLTLAAERKGDLLVLRVRDTGIGLSPEMLPRVFDLFVQEHQALDRAQGGLGLGLSIVRVLVELHGGTVEAHSAGHGRGSEFVVRLPAIPAAEETETAEGAEPRAAAAPREAAPAAGGGLRILIVDDNADAAELLATSVERMGHRAEVAHDGPQGLAAAARFRPEVALLDIGLPVMDGYELAAHLRALPGLAGLRLIAVSGYSQETDLEHAAAAGFESYLVKPIRLERLAEVLAAVSGARDDAV
jgi:signal transduction histidine kinase/ActR/RegA family two-component response regulator